MATLEEIRRWARGERVDGFPSGKPAPAAELPKLTRRATNKYTINTEGTDAILKFGSFRGEALSKLVMTPRGRTYLKWLIGRDFDDDLKEICRYQLKKYSDERKATAR